MRRSAVPLLALALSLTNAATAQTTITVGQGGGYDYSTIQSAIDAATTGDTVIVHPGTYVENIHFHGKNIVLRSTDPTETATVAATIIDGNQAGSVVTFAGTETSSCILSGFTITNAYARPRGGGVLGNGTHGTVQHNIISTNTATEWGGGLYECHGTIRDNLVFGNMAHARTVSGAPFPVGGGGGIAYCNGTIQNNTISGNWTYFLGGGLHLCHGTIRNNTISGNLGDGLSGCDGTIENNTISDNRDDGLDGCDGTIRNNTISGNEFSGLHRCQGTIQNNTISGNIGIGILVCHGTIQSNTISYNTGRYHVGGALQGCYATIRNCIIWGNQGQQIVSCSVPSYSCIQGWSGEGLGNISDDPQFTNPANGDYHLLARSPCINAGASFYWFDWPHRDLDGNCRLVGTDIDMGCYEYGSSPDSDGDLLADGDERRSGTDPLVADMDGDGLRDGLEMLRGSDPLVVTVPGVFHIPRDIPTIQKALAVGLDGDEIVVSSGIYRGPLQFCGADVALRSENPENPAITAATILAGGGVGGSTVSFQGDESEVCILAGFTITNGRSLFGGGIHGRGTNATVQYNTVRHNTVEGGGSAGGGGGGGLYGLNGTIQNNTIFGNTTDWNSSGGGLASCMGTIQNNTISSNTAGRDGGGLHRCNGTIQNNMVSNNTAERGGGLYECHGTIQNNTIVGNGLYDCRGAIRNCIIWPRSGTRGVELNLCSTPSHSCIQNWPGGGVGNISKDPHFTDTLNGDHHLRAGSPCIDAGVSYYWFQWPQHDLDGNCRLAGARVDMGCYEYGASPDFDGDLVADGDELVIGTDPFFADTDSDGLRDGLEVLRGSDPRVGTFPDYFRIPQDIPTIQQALAVSVNGDEIVVSPATNSGNIQLCGANVILRSENPTHFATVTETILDSGGVGGPVVRFQGNESDKCVLAGFTIRNGVAYLGAGVCGPTRATVEYNTISNNWAIRGGGLSGCNGTIQYNTICSNIAVLYAAGLACCDGTIQNNMIFRNATLNNFGGGLYECHGTIQNNTVFHNRCGFYGAGLYGCTGTIRNCIIWGNSAKTEAQIYMSSTPSHSCIQNWSGGGDGNISDDPQLADPANGDFHLLPSSPCVDAGGRVSLTEDFEGDPRPYDFTDLPRGDGSDFDIGADEAVPAFELRTAADPLEGGRIVPAGTTRHYLARALTVTAIPNCGWSFDRWSGDAAGTTNPLVVVMDRTKTLTAHFVAIPGADLEGRLDGVLPSAIVVGHPLSLQGEVSNTGDGPSAVAFWVEFWLHNKETGWRGVLCDSIRIGPLGAGESFDLAGIAPPRVAYANIPAGTYAIEMRVDVLGEVAESCETNNVARWEPCVILPDRPNLVVTGFDFSPQDVAPDGGTTMTFSGLVQNTGSRSTTGSFWIEFRVSRRLPFNPAGPYVCDSLGVTQAIGPGETLNIGPLLRTTYTLPPGVYYVGIRLDPLDAIAEQREDDNVTWLPRKKLYAGSRPTGAVRWTLFR